MMVLGISVIWTKDEDSDLMQALDGNTNTLKVANLNKRYRGDFIIVSPFIPHTINKKRSRTIIRTI